MKSYIFTQRERTLLQKWLNTGQKADETVDMIFHRVKSFRDLENDVQLYLRVKDRLKQLSSTPRSRASE